MQTSRGYAAFTLTIRRMGALAGKHAIFYRGDADGSLLIVRILHTAMLPELHLPGQADDDGDQDD